MGYVLIVDIDETICNTKERKDRIIKRKGDIANWSESCVVEFLNPDELKNDKVVPGAEIIIPLAKRLKAKLIILTGRNERSREDTKNWLKEKVGISNRIPLIMRHNDDYSRPADCKENLFLKHVEPSFKNSKFVFFEDDPEIIGRWAKYGLVLKAPEIWGFINKIGFEK